MVNPVVLVTPGLIINGIVLSWIFKIERQCECSRDWRRDVIKYVSIAGLVQALAIAARIRIPPVVLMIMTLAGLVYLYSVLTYIPKLQRDCSCATEYEWRDNFMFWWNLVGLVLAVAGVVFAVARR
jgi:hypothetical protein